jgi:hypothetical protein
MPTARTSRKDEPEGARRSRPQTVPREYAGRWIAWSADGRRIIAVEDDLESCEQAAAHAGFAADQVAIERVPETRDRLTGSVT